MEKRKKKFFRSHKNPIQVMQIFASYKIESNEFIQKHLLWDELRSVNVLLLINNHECTFCT